MIDLTNSDRNLSVLISLAHPARVTTRSGAVLGVSWRFCGQPPAQLELDFGGLPAGGVKGPTPLGRGHGRVVTSARLGCRYNPPAWDRIPLDSMIPFAGRCTA